MLCSSLGAYRAPIKKITAAISIVTSVNPNPSLRFEWSLTTPISFGENASPNTWIANNCPAIAVALRFEGTAFNVAAFTGPVPRKIKNTATPSAGSVTLFGPKKQSNAGGAASAALNAGT